KTKIASSSPGRFFLSAKRWSSLDAKLENLAGAGSRIGGKKALDPSDDLGRISRRWGIGKMGRMGIMGAMMFPRFGGHCFSDFFIGVHTSVLVRIGRVI